MKKIFAILIASLVIVGVSIYQFTKPEIYHCDAYTVSVDDANLPSWKQKEVLINKEQVTVENYSSSFVIKWKSGKRFESESMNPIKGYETHNQRDYYANHLQLKKSVRGYFKANNAPFYAIRDELRDSYALNGCEKV
ncbi:hypothetical protein D5R38_18600 [Serratia marcescens]|uniref:hypothetical protein n=1 Tax=Serratia marcescens TaxID=615 RepID=UPI001068B375|nr:hypothetical protein [Serratia marcescens]TEW83381.1 hypothetical protein D5R38_18600 [Serratia marcescens]